MQGVPREDGFDITVASEIMAVLCLASDIPDLKERLARIVVAYTYDGKAVTAADLKAHGAMAALLCWLYFQENTIQTRSGARHALDAPIIATVCRERVRGRKKKGKAIQVFAPSASFAYTEQINTICTRLEQESAKGAKVFLVAGAGENEGKSTIAANLALALSEKDRKVVLLDCDFRKPSLHKIFEMPVQKEKTLSAYLLQEELGPASYLTQLKKNGIILGFSHNSNRNISRLLNNGKLPALLKYLKEK